jgi:5-formaminoimidazole-4-carboxamide-1-beta-D-ribofuranosyl 5'-monophosphate synthetase
MKSLENNLIEMMVRLEDLRNLKTSVKDSDSYLFAKLSNDYSELIEEIEEIDDEDTGMYFLKEYFGAEETISNFYELPVAKRVKLILELLNN